MLQPLLGVRKRPFHLFICFAIYTFADLVVFNNRATIGLLVQDSGNRVIIIFTHPWYHHIIIELCHKNDYLHYQCLIFMIDIITLVYTRVLHGPKEKKVFYLLWFPRIYRHLTWARLYLVASFDLRYTSSLLLHYH